MGRKSLQELEQEQLLNDSEFAEILSDSYSLLNKNEKNEIALSLYKFTKLMFDNIN